MTVESKDTKKIYDGNGVATEFPVKFAYSRVDDLFLLRADEEGVETPINSNFSITVNTTGDTTVTYPVVGTPLPVGQKVAYRPVYG